MSLALRGRLVTPTGVVDDGVVEVSDGLVSAVVGASEWRGPAPEPVGTVAPGFVDVHCHGGGGYAFSSSDPAEVAAAAAHHLAHGTTTQLASLVSAGTDELSASLAIVADLVAAGSSVVGSHLEGPWLAPGHCGAHDPAHLTKPTMDVAERWLAAANGTLRMVTLAPELPGAAEVSALLQAADTLVALGHTGADVATFASALDALRTPVVTHLFNGMEPMHHRRPGPVAAALTALARAAAFPELIADGVHLHPASVRLVFATDPGRHVLLVSDAMAAAGMPDGPYRLGALDVTVTGGQAWLAGDKPSLAGSTAHLADVVRHCVTAAGIDPVQAVAAASATPAALLGLTDRGALATGLRADLIVLDDAWHVTRVLHGGAWVR